IDPVTGKVRHDLKELMDGTFSLAFSPDGKALAAAHQDSFNRYAVRVWDVAAGAERWQTKSQRGAFGAFLPGGRTLLEISYGQIRFWDPATGKATLPAEAAHSNRLWWGGMCLSRDGKLLAHACGPMVRVWDVTTGRQVGSPEGGIQHKVRAVAFGPD